MLKLPKVNTKYWCRYLVVILPVMAGRGVFVMCMEHFFGWTGAMNFIDALIIAFFVSMYTWSEGKVKDQGDFIMENDGAIKKLFKAVLDLCEELKNMVGDADRRN